MSNLPYTPQIIVSPNTFINDKVNWVEFNMQYKAMGGEEYITLGNFYDTAIIDTQFVVGGGKQYWHLNTYYYIDDVWLSHCDSLPDSLIGIAESHLKNQVSVYPNPFQNEFVIETNSKKELSFRLFDSFGRASTPLSMTKTEIGYRVMVGDIPKGIYLLHIDDGKEQVSFKIIKN